jgi:hypothetical protein
MMNHTPAVRSALLVAVTLAGACATNKGEKEIPVQVADMSAPARTSLDQVIRGGHVDKVTREVERGRTVYDVEATIDGKHREFLIADSDGAVLGTENEIAFDELPDAVRASAQKYFDPGAKLKAMKGVEYGETSYELEGPRSGKTVEASFDPSGKRVP